MKRLAALVTIVLVLALGVHLTMAADAGTKDEAVALVKKAIEYIKANGKDKGFEEISNPQGQFVDRDLYVVVYDMNGKCLAHGANAKMGGKISLTTKTLTARNTSKNGSR